MNWKLAQKDYQHYLKIERGLADNSISNYLLDVEKLKLFLDSNALSVSPVQIQKETVQQFIFMVQPTECRVIGPRASPWL